MSLVNLLAVKLLAASCELQVASCKLRAASCELRVGQIMQKNILTVMMLCSI